MAEDLKAISEAPTPAGQAGGVQEGETMVCPICGGHDDDRQLQCEACGGVGMLGTIEPEAPQAPATRVTEEALDRVAKLMNAAKSKAEWHEEEGRGTAADHNRREQRLWSSILSALTTPPAQDQGSSSLPAMPEGWVPDREKAARLIDPAAFSMATRKDGSKRYEDARDRVDRAYSLADQVLALPPLPTPSPAKKGN